jgi:hypothetical protein
MLYLDVLDVQATTGSQRLDRGDDHRVPKISFGSAGMNAKGVQVLCFAAGRFQ